MKVTFYENKHIVFIINDTFREQEVVMIDVIIIAVIAMAVFFIVRRELRRFRKGQCCSGCSGCNCGCKSGEESSAKKNKRA